jgi:hypothetical protein
MDDHVSSLVARAVVGTARTGLLFRANLHRKEHGAPRFDTACHERGVASPRSPANHNRMERRVKWLVATRRSSRENLSAINRKSYLTVRGHLRSGPRCVG